MGHRAVVVVSLDEQMAGGAYLLREVADALQPESLPNLCFLDPTPIEAVHNAENPLPKGFMFLGTVIAKRSTEVGRLTDIDLWNPSEYKHDLLSPWHRRMTKAKKGNQIPPLARALFLHHEEVLRPDQIAATILPMVRRIGLWTRFWNNQQNKKATPAT